MKDWIVPGKYSNLGKIDFVTPEAMWAWVKAHAGQKLSALGRDDLSWSLDKPFNERQLGKKVGHVLKSIKKYFEKKLCWAICWR